RLVRVCPAVGVHEIEPETLAHECERHTRGARDDGGRNELDGGWRRDRRQHACDDIATRRRALELKDSREFFFVSTERHAVKHRRIFSLVPACEQIGHVLTARGSPLAGSPGIFARRLASACSPSYAAYLYASESAGKLNTPWMKK